MPKTQNVMGLLQRLQSDDITVHQSRCVAVRNRNATCMRCAEVCTTGCISYRNNELTVAPERCIGCGTCATACPTCALEAHNPTDAELTRACMRALREADGQAVIACERMLQAAEGLYDPEKVVGVTCLGRVEESLIVTLAASGARRIRLVEGGCEGCEYASGREMAQRVCETANTLLEVWDCDARVGVSGKLPSLVRKRDKGYDADKRLAFMATGQGAKSAAAEAADYTVRDTLDIEEPPEPRLNKVDESGVLPQFVPDRRAVLRSALERLGQPRDDMIETRLWGHVVIEPDACNSCQMCATFCPTGALRRYRDEDGSPGIAHAPADCVKCHCCEDICMKDALWISDEVFAVDLLEDVVERFEMEETILNSEKPNKMFASVKSLVGGDQVYER